METFEGFLKEKWDREIVKALPEDNPRGWGGDGEIQKKNLESGRGKLGKTPFVGDFQHSKKFTLQKKIVEQAREKLSQKVVYYIDNCGYK